MHGHVCGKYVSSVEARVRSTAATGRRYARASRCGWCAARSVPAHRSPDLRLARLPWPARAR